jgi:hypothetical protein
MHKWMADPEEFKYGFHWSGRLNCRPEGLATAIVCSVTMTSAFSNIQEYTTVVTNDIVVNSSTYYHFDINTV